MSQACLGRGGLVLGDHALLVPLGQASQLPADPGSSVDTLGCTRGAMASITMKTKAPATVGIRTPPERSPSHHTGSRAALDFLISAHADMRKDRFLAPDLPHASGGHGQQAH